METKLTPDEIRAGLAYCTGTESYHHWSILFRNMVLTDGAKFLADSCGAYWLMDIIASHMPKVPYDDGFAVAKLTLDVTGGADFKLEDGNDKLHAHQHIEYTDFPLPEGVALYVIADGTGRWVILLPSEY